MATRRVYTRAEPWRSAEASRRGAQMFAACVIGCEERGVKTANGKIQKEQEQTEAQPDGA